MLNFWNFYDRRPFNFPKRTSGSWKHDDFTFFFRFPFYLWLSCIRIFSLNSFPDPGSTVMLEMTGGVVEQRGVRRAAGEGAGHTQQEPQPAAHVLHRLVTLFVGLYWKFMVTTSTYIWISAPKLLPLSFEQTRCKPLGPPPPALGPGRGGG